MAKPKTEMFGKTIIGTETFHVLKRLSEKGIIVMVDSNEHFIVAAKGVNKTTLRKLLK